jgi:hypothetical protein
MSFAVNDGTGINWRSGGHADKRSGDRRSHCRQHVNLRARQPWLKIVAESGL